MGEVRGGERWEGQRKVRGRGERWGGGGERDRGR